MTRNRSTRHVLQSTIFAAPKKNLIFVLLMIWCFLVFFICPAQHNPHLNCKIIDYPYNRVRVRTWMGAVQTSLGALRAKRHVPIADFEMSTYICILIHPCDFDWLKCQHFSINVQIYIDFKLSSFNMCEKRELPKAFDRTLLLFSHKPHNAVLIIYRYIIRKVLPRGIKWYQRHWLHYWGFYVILS
jgi:hypothetical protein